MGCLVGCGSSYAWITQNVPRTFPRAGVDMRKIDTPKREVIGGRAAFRYGDHHLPQGMQKTAISGKEAAAF